MCMCILYIKTHCRFHLVPGFHSNSRWLSKEEAADMHCLDEDKSPISSSLHFVLHKVK